MTDEIRATLSDGTDAHVIIARGARRVVIISAHDLVSIQHPEPMTLDECRMLRDSLDVVLTAAVPVQPEPAVFDRVEGCRHFGADTCPEYFGEDVAERVQPEPQETKP